ncbi:MAG: isopentenyl-diphosphate Delta-isomerase [Gemmatimonadaceae bacterium]
MTSQPAEVAVILVDEHDRAIGVCEKLAAHRRGVRHRAVSVFAFDAEGRLLMQRRAAGKYHSGGLWSNSACTHPRVGESLEDAARRALREELGLECDNLRYAFPFTYKAAVGKGLTEHEYDHVFVCRAFGEPRAVASEVSDAEYASMTEVAASIRAEPERYTVWFALLLGPVMEWWAKQ